MKKRFTLGAGIIAVSVMSGCANKPPVEECVFPDDAKVAAPGWVCDQPVDGYSMTAVGSAESSGAGQDFMKQMAATSARVQLAQRMRVTVVNMIKQYAETTGAAKGETVDLVNSSVTKQLTDESLIGSKVIKSRASPTGRFYVLLAMDPDSVAKAAESALKTSMNNDKALWQKFQSQKAQDELAADIAKQRAR